MSDEVALVFANKATLKTNHSIQAQITKASATLTPSQRRKIKKLAHAENLSTACELLKNADANEGDWLAIFSKTKIKSLLDTWDATIWDTLVREMQPLPQVYELLKAAIEKRINYTGSDSAVYWRFTNSLQPIMESSSEMKSLIDDLLTSRGMRASLNLKER